MVHTSRETSHRSCKAHLLRGSHGDVSSGWQRARAGMLRQLEKPQTSMQRPCQAANWRIGPAESTRPTRCQADVNRDPSKQNHTTKEVSATKTRRKTYLAHMECRSRGSGECVRAAESGWTAMGEVWVSMQVLTSGVGQLRRRGQPCGYPKAAAN